MTLEEIKAIASNAGISKDDVKQFGNPAKKDSWILALANRANTQQTTVSQQVLSLIDKVEHPVARHELHPILARLAQLSQMIEKSSN